MRASRPRHISGHTTTHRVPLTHLLRMLTDHWIQCAVLSDISAGELNSVQNFCARCVEKFCSKYLDIDNLIKQVMATRMNSELRAFVKNISKLSGSQVRKRPERIHMNSERVHMNSWTYCCFCSVRPCKFFSLLTCLPTLMLCGLP